MTYTELTGGRVPIRMWAEPSEVEEQAMGQLRNIAALPWVHGVAVMPDVHYGKGATVGSVIAMRDAVSPAAVGVDIGCGMSAVKTSLKARHLPDDLGPLRSAIEAAVPVGFNRHDEAVDPATLPDLPSELGGSGGWRGFWDGFEGLAGPVGQLRDRAGRQLGTLGGGNHFIEVCLDTEDGVWLVLHSGSRNIGKELAEHHMGIARDLPHNQDLPDRDLAVFTSGTPEMDAYRRDLYWAQEYARRNRALMMALLKDVVRHQLKKAAPEFEPEISCHHNYVSEETYDGADLLVTRKGAIRAGRGDLGIIPGSMGTRSYIVRGLGNPDSFRSASHGAGRRLSRNKARKQYSTADLARQTRGVECRKDGGVLDEIPAAYKKIERVMAQQSDLVEVAAELRQVVCVKG
ncbi:RNA-splicing ligase RtcB [Mangrovactinospora gilvigrisea]|uniref:3'-phosphate/5'-hydroxy nucleic acid ligase n=1 Tax=Mangrovactinospora gilvigrisea TaxID=1428644 RepID=A0A1J7BA29_9ACTN|nr:RtcB family protein [Mangrovactinospora gilvigrisea]OIV35453.1 RNA-splicing ligase RtcB [Mangrovactinospora gilvigrisea]